MTKGKISIKIFLAITGILLASFQVSAMDGTFIEFSNEAIISPVAESGESGSALAVGQETETRENLSLWQKFVTRYQQASLKVKILVGIVVYLIFSLTLLLLFILINRTIKTRERKQASNIKSIYQDELTNFLFGEEDQTFEFTGINHEINRDIFINELLSLHNNLFGEAANRLRDLYFNLELYKDSLRKVNYRNWSLKAKGFRELAQMDVKDANRNIAKYINSRNEMLRMESQQALVKLNEEDPLGFLDDLKYELTEWEQVNILDTLDYHQIYIESFDRWMTSENDSVVIFATRLAGHYKHIHSWPQVLNLLEHKNPKVRQFAIKTLDLLEVAENAGPLKEIYQQDQRLEEKDDDAFYNLNMDRNRLAAIEAMAAIATPADLPFLEQVLKTEKKFRILKRAVAITAGIKPGGPELLDQVFESADPELRKIIEITKQTAAQ
ncbi:MAG: HEAT repeat domain-containing protein [Bacteroidales bacterium]|nr:HEAT repeat domain-containing protein [Bacteroidales bacterium]